MSTGMRKWMEKGCPDIPTTPAEVSIGREELRQLRDELAQYKNERDALQAKIEAMERQEPVAWTTKLALEYGASRLGFQVSGVNIWGENGVPLYALPGAQPAPSVPDGWKLVPIEPTIAMCLAGDKPRLQIGDGTPTPAIYRAMIAAAPEAKP